MDTTGIKFSRVVVDINDYELMEVRPHDSYTVDEMRLKWMAGKLREKRIPVAESTCEILAGRLEWVDLHDKAVRRFCWLGYGHELLKEQDATAI